MTKVQLPRLSAVLSVLAVVAALFAGAPHAAAQAKGGKVEWAATWQASPQQPRAATPTLENQTLRQVARISIGGPQLRIRLSNEFGEQPLTIGAAHVALAGAGSSIQPGSDRAATFNGQASVTIPPGGVALSDPVTLEVVPLQSVSVSLYFPKKTGQPTEHPFASQTSYVARGDLAGAQDMPVVTPMTQRLVLTGVEVPASKKTKVVVALGDSTTDGFGSTPDTNRRWPDLLANRISTDRKNPIAVVNAGIGGNRLLHDFIGPNALSRLDRDVLNQAKVSHVVVLIGINDFGFPGGRKLPDEDVSAQQVIDGLKQLIQRAHKRGVKVIGATILPFNPIPDRPGYYSPAAEAKRMEVNAWIRTGKAFDGVLDFEAAVKDPNGMRLAPGNDSGDHLNPNDMGYNRMAYAVDPKIFN